VVEITFKMVRETPCGYWIKEFITEHWVSKPSRKRFAYPTQNEAMVNFKARKTRQIGILSRQLERAKIALTYVQNDQPESTRINPLKIRGVLWQKNQY